ncbi:hypothetical protein IT570_14630 [Candidatus Sumerlaeota bacterium]|nr:hypothetical protein [Candidatus Sumerlaeota bacterium]
MPQPPVAEKKITTKEAWKGTFLAAVVLCGALLLMMICPNHRERGWNVNTRLALVFAVGELGRLEIDPFHETKSLETMDKALFNGHYYSDKIFGVSLLALPFYKMFGDVQSIDDTAWMLKNFCAALPGAVAALLFFLLLVKTGTPPRWAVAITLFATLGTIWFGYSTVFYPYSLGICCALGALHVLFFPPAGRITPLNSASVGFLLGYTLLCDLIFAMLVAGIALVWLMRLADQIGVVGMRAFAQMRGQRIRATKAAFFILIGGIAGAAPLVLFAAYCHSIFGSFSVPYQYEVSDRFREGMSAGIMGVTAPRIDVLWFITFHPYRGIFYWSPIMLAAIAGCIVATRQYGKRRVIGWLGLYAFLAYLLFNAGYYMWWGGWCMGPRFLLPALPFALLGLGELVRDDKLSAYAKSSRHAVVASRTMVVALGVLSMALTLPLALYDPQIPQGNQDAVLDAATWGTQLQVPQLQIIKAFYSGRLPLSVGHESATAIIACLLVMVAAVAAAILIAPRAIPGLERNDFPFHTVDGTAAPPPPIP